MTQNYEGYISGNYHCDLINAIEKIGIVYKYGKGYSNYDINDTIEDVFYKMNITLEMLDYIIVGTTWEEQDESLKDSDPHPKICLNTIPSSIKKIFFINKEYKKIQAKLDYIKKNCFDIVVTVLPYKKYKAWENETQTTFFQSHFAIDTKQFYDLQLNRKYDFTFTGSLHTRYTDKRIRVKRKMFLKPEVLSNRGIPRLLSLTNPLEQNYRKYNIYWAEWGKWSKDINGKSLLPTGKDYVNLMCQSKTFFSTLSADGIFGTRFFEIMATGALLFCPEDDYYGVLKNGVNCIMYKEDLSNFDNQLYEAINDEDARIEITKTAIKFASQQTYDNRIQDIFAKLTL